MRSPIGTRYMLADGVIGGLALSVKENGSASYVFQYRTLAGQPRRHGLGVAAPGTLAGARAAAEKMRGAVREGRDPIEERRAARTEAQAAQASTVRRYLLDTYDPVVLAHRKDGNGTKARILASWEALLDTPLTQVTREAVEKVLSDRKAATNPDGSRLLTNATLRATFRSMLAHAVRGGQLAALPMMGKPEAIHGLREEPRRRYLGQNDTPEETAKGNGERGRFLKALGDFDSHEPGGGGFLRVACTMALNTGCRRGELLKLREDMVKLRDLGNERIELPGAICKSGKGRDLYLNPAAIAALKAWLEVRKTLKVQSVDGALFPGKLQCWEDRLSQREFPRLCVEAGIEDLTYHDLRRTFASLHVQGGTPLMEVQKMLGHSSIVVTESHYAYLAPSAGKAAARAFRVS